MLTFFYVCYGVTYWIAVFDYVLPRLNVAKGVFVTVVEIYLNVVKLIY